MELWQPEAELVHSWRLGRCRDKHHHPLCGHLSQQPEFHSEEASLRLAQYLGFLDAIRPWPSVCPLAVCPAWLTAGPESHAASLAPQLCGTAATELRSPIPLPAWLFLRDQELWGWLGELMLAPMQSWPSSHLPCSHPTHRTPVGVPATEVGRKPRKKHSSNSFLFFSFSRQSYHPLSPLLQRGLKSH